MYFRRSSIYYWTLRFAKSSYVNVINPKIMSEHPSHKSKSPDIQMSKHDVQKIMSKTSCQCFETSKCPKNHVQTSKSPNHHMSMFNCPGCPGRAPQIQFKFNLNSISVPANDIYTAFLCSIWILFLCQRMTFTLPFCASEWHSHCLSAFLL